MADIIKSEALILRSIRWHESSKIIYLYSREWGRIGLIAKGALRPKSPFAGNLETLNYVLCQIAHKPSRELQILTAIDVLNPFNEMRLNLEQLPYALAILELLDQIMEGHTSDGVFFDFTVKMLQSIGTTKRPEPIFWYFLIKLSSFLGFRPQLQKCQICHTDKTEGVVYFDLRQGSLYCADCAANSAAGMKLEQELWQFLKMLQTYPHQKILKFADSIKRDYSVTPLLIQYLNIHLEKNITLKSLDLLS